MKIIHRFIQFIIVKTNRTSTKEKHFILMNNKFLAFSQSTFELQLCYIDKVYNIKKMKKLLVSSLKMKNILNKKVFTVTE